MILQRRNLIAFFVLPGLMPAGADRDEEGLAVGVLVFEQLFSESRIGDVGKVFLEKLLALAVKLVGQTFDEEQTEDEFLELGSVHLATQDVGGLKKEAFELGESDLFAGHVIFLGISTSLAEGCVILSGRSRGSGNHHGIHV